MPRYAILKDGQLVNTVLASEEWAPPEGHTKELFDPAVHTPPAPPAPTERWINSYRFLFELHSVAQQVQLDAFRAAAADMYRRFFAIGKEAGGFNHNIDANVTPGNICRVAFAKHPYGLTINN